MAGAGGESGPEWARPLATGDAVWMMDTSCLMDEGVHASGGDLAEGADHAGDDRDVWWEVGGVSVLLAQLLHWRGGILTW